MAESSRTHRHHCSLRNKLKQTLEVISKKLNTLRPGLRIAELPFILDFPADESTPHADKSVTSVGISDYLIILVHQDIYMHPTHPMNYRLTEDVSITYAQALILESYDLRKFPSINL